ncbi:MAG: hypothetical protein WC794_06050 [Candidatus Doudnabacteria bacterium]|jgi:hypothetical protein
MSYQGIKNTIFFVVLVGILFNVSFFCHFFSMGMGEHSEMGQVFTKSVSFISTNEAHCCTSQNSALVFSDQVLAAKSTNQILLLENVLGFIFLLGIAFNLNLLDSQNGSRYWYYRGRSLFARVYNYILQSLSRGILQPQIYNA